MLCHAGCDDDDGDDGDDHSLKNTVDCIGSVVHLIQGFYKLP